MLLRRRRLLLRFFGERSEQAALRQMGGYSAAAPSPIIITVFSRAKRAGRVHVGELNKAEVEARMGSRKGSKKGSNNWPQKGGILRVLTAHWECI